MPISLKAPVPASAPAETTTPALIPGLLPKIALLKKPAARATADAAQQTTETPRTAPGSAFTPLATASALLSHTTTTLSRAVGGGYKLSFEAEEYGSTILAWQYGSPTVGGSGSIPQFSAAYDCNPPPGGNSSFPVRSSFDCSVALTPLSGADLRTMSANFSFSTGPGELFASPPSNMNTHLSNSENDGGFVFTNDDSEPITITSETFSVSYTGLITSYGPLILRVLDPANQANYIDYHLENIPAASTSSYEHYASGITIGMPLTVDAASAKMLPVEVLDAHKLSIQGLNPDVTITLAGIATNRNDIAMELGAPSVSWSCIVASGFYDPNATSGPFATGDACQN